MFLSVISPWPAGEEELLEDDMRLPEWELTIVASKVSLGAPFIWPCATSKQKA